MKGKIRLKIGFTSGRSIKVYCTSYSITLNGAPSFSFQGLDRNVSINLDHVEYVQED